SLATKIISASFVSELVLVNEDNTKSKILSEINLIFEKNVITTLPLHIISPPKIIKNRSYQEGLLKKIFFDNEIQLFNSDEESNEIHKDILSTLGLTYYGILTLSLIVLLEFIGEHDPFLLSKLSRPIISEYSGWLNINARIIFQLNIVS